MTTCHRVTHLDQIISMRLMRDACVIEGTIGAVRYHTTALRGSACVRCSWGDWVRIYRAVNHVDKADYAAQTGTQIEEEIRETRIKIAARAAVAVAAAAAATRG